MDTLDLLRSGQLAGSQRLDLAGGLIDFPLEILALADSLEILDLSGNRLSTLPDAFSQLHRLRIVFFNDNAFETLPEVLGQCPNLSMVGFKSNQIRAIADHALPETLRWLILTNNQLERLPPTIGKLCHLQKCMLAGNRLRSLPDTMAACQNLELLRIAANQLTELPPWLLTLPRLSWLAYAGNPFCQTLASTVTTLSESLPEIDWADLTPGAVLGQGASGVIIQGQWHQPGASLGASLGPAKEVAIKLFKGDVTSDGFPTDEMTAIIAAGFHPDLVQVLGRLVNHPEQKSGLIFALIPPEYRILGGPPSLVTCTRDTYPPETSFSLAIVLRIVQGIAAVTGHLHDRGLMHGDLYAHNILVDPAGNSLLSDFGAASFYQPRDAQVGTALEQIEVRAFGCLLEDLLDRCPVADSAPEAATIAALRQLQQQCLTSVPSDRPLFAAIKQRLAAFSAAP